MNYLKQRKLFNEIVAVELIKQLRYSKGKNAYRAKVRENALKQCMENAYHIPFYKKRFDESGVRPEDIKERKDLIKLPILTKDEFRNWMNEEQEKSENKLCMMASTSGSTGRPLKVVNTPYEYAIEIANVLRAWIICGYNPFIGKTLTEYDDTSENVGYKSLIQKLGILRREVVDADGVIEEIISTINKFKPDLIRMYKSEFMRIAIYAQKNGVCLHKPHFYCVQGENLDEISAGVLENTFGTHLINLYGCVEAGTIGVKKPKKNNYEILDDIVAVNIYDQNNNLTDEVGRIIFTTLYKDTFPLINYEVCDKAILAENDYGTFFTQIYGRENDEIKYKDGTSTHWIVLWHIIAKQHDILQVRFVQESLDRVILQIVKSEKSKLTETEIEKKLLDDLGEEVANRIQIVFQWMQEIPLDSKGKLRMIISNI